MRSCLFLAVAMAFAAPAGAQVVAEPGPTDVTRISGLIPSVCTVETESPAATIRLQVGTEQDVTDVSYTCNSPTGFTRRITSENGGSLVRNGQGIAYVVSQTGNADLAFAPVRLSGPIVTEVVASRELAAGTTGMLRVALPALPTGLIAGQYLDTITIEIVPN